MSDFQLRNKELCDKWDAQYGDHKTIVNLLLESAFKDREYALHRLTSSEESWMIERIVLRYQQMQYLIEKGFLDSDNLKGHVLDVGCCLGLSTDALGMFGGMVEGTDKGFFAYRSPSGIELHPSEGLAFVKRQSENGYQPTLISCFNADWVEEMSGSGWAQQFHDASIKALHEGGQVLMTFSGRYQQPVELSAKLSEKRACTRIDLPDAFKGMEDYIIISIKS